MVMASDAQLCEFESQIRIKESKHNEYGVLDEFFFPKYIFVFHDVYTIECPPE